MKHNVGFASESNIIMPKNRGGDAWTQMKRNEAEAKNKREK